MQDAMLESRNISGKPGWRDSDVFGQKPVKLWAPAATWKGLEAEQLRVPSQRQFLAPGPGGSREPSVAVGTRKPEASVSWIFVPTYNRYHAEPGKQMLLDWADVMPADHCYVRFIVVRPIAGEILVSPTQLNIDPIRSSHFATWSTHDAMLLELPEANHHLHCLVRRIKQRFMISR